MKQFKELGISESILQVIEEQKFAEPSEIQEKSIPIILEGRDVIGGSATGSGKTLAFATGIIQRCPRRQGIQALVLTPTRELAEQVGKTIIKFSKYSPLQAAIVYGGVAINPQMEELRRAEVVIGTPGRILDHLERRTIDLSHVQILVLDEADRMLDMGFIDDVKAIMQRCPQQRQTLLFSATISTDIEELSRRFMNNPLSVAVESYVDPSKLKQEYYDVPHNLKFSLLVHLLKQEQAGLVMVFCNTRHNVDFVAKNLAHNDVEAIAIHGGLSQSKRNRIIESFHKAKVYVLVCTDVAARGLDIPGVSHVYNYDIPADSKQYVHRIGRTARAGKEGKAVSILSERDHENFSRVLRDTRFDIQTIETPRVERARIKLDERRDFGRRPQYGRERRPQRGQFRGEGRRY